MQGRIADGSTGTVQCVPLIFSLSPAIVKKTRLKKSRCHSIRSGFSLSFSFFYSFLPVCVCVLADRFKALDFVRRQSINQMVSFQLKGLWSSNFYFSPSLSLFPLSLVLHDRQFCRICVHSDGRCPAYWSPLSNAYSVGSTSPRSNRRNHLPILDGGGCTRPDGQVENIKIDKRARQHAFNKP